METASPAIATPDRISRRWHVALILATLMLTGLGAYIVGPVLRLPHGAPVEVQAGWDGDQSPPKDPVFSTAAGESGAAVRSEAARAIFLKAEQNFAKPTEAQRLFKQIVSNYADTAWAERAKLRLSEIADVRDGPSEPKVIFDRLQEQVLILTEWGEYTGADELCQQYLSSKPPSDLAAKIPDLRASIQKEAERELAQAVQEADRLTSKSKFTRARRLLSQAQKIFTDERATTLLKSQLAAVDRAEEQAAAAQQRDDLAKAMRSRIRGICDTCVRGDYELALRRAEALAEEAGKLEAADQAALAKALLLTINTERDFRENLLRRIADNPRKATGLQITPKIQGTIVSVTREKLVVEVSRGATTEVAWNSLPPETLLALGTLYQRRRRVADPSASAEDNFSIAVLAAHRRLYKQMEQQIFTAQADKPALAESIQQLRKVADANSPEDEGKNKNE
ncbi:MAG TPA: hypothetical protein VGP72_33150 [Planctomycetota bacterium]